MMAVWTKRKTNMTKTKQALDPLVIKIDYRQIMANSKTIDRDLQTLSVEIVF